MWWWTDGWWWPGVALMAVFMVICVALMARMMGSMGGMDMCGLGRWREVRDRADAGERTFGERSRTHVDTPD
jgi:hypothetical protein